MPWSPDPRQLPNTASETLKAGRKDQGPSWGGSDFR